MSLLSPQALLLSILSTMPSGKDGRWSDAHEQAYVLGLSDVPGSDCMMLAKAVQRKYDWRPSVKQILDTHAELFAVSESESVTDVLGSLRELVAQYGENGAVHPNFPDRYPRITHAGPPPEFRRMSVQVQKTVNALGGWIDFARNFDWSNPADRAQFRDLYKAVSQSASEVALKQIRLEYQAAKPPVLEVATDEIPEYSDSNIVFGRDDAANFMAAVAGKVKAI